MKLTSITYWGISKKYTDIYGKVNISFYRPDKLYLTRQEARDKVKSLKNKWHWLGCFTPVKVKVVTLDKICAC